MPTLPRADIFIARPTGPAQVEADPNMFAAEGRGLQQLGAGISDAAQAGAQIALKFEHARFVSKSAEADRKVKTAWTAYQEQMATSPGKPDEWVKGWNDTYAKVSKDVDMTGLSKPAQMRLQEQMKAFQAESTASIGLQATKQSFKNGAAEITASASLDLKNGDIMGYERKINEGAAAGFFDPATQNKLLEQGKIDYDVEQANRAINDNPITAVDALEEKTEGGNWKNFKNVSENQRLSLLTEAKRKTSTLRAETSQAVYERRGAGELIEPEELQLLVEKKLLTANQAKGIMQEQKRSGDDPAVIPRFSQALRDVSNYDPRKDPAKEQYAKLVQERGWFPGDMKQELEKQLNAQVKLSGDSTAGDTAVRSYVNKMLDDGVFGDIGKFPATDAKRAGKIRDPQAYQKAYSTHVEITGALQDFMVKNPKATPTQQMEFVQSKMSTMTTTNAALPILNSIAGKAQTPVRANAASKAGKYKVIKVGE